MQVFGDSSQSAVATGDSQINNEVKLTIKLYKADMERHHCRQPISHCHIVVTLGTYYKNMLYSYI